VLRSVIMRVLVIASMVAATFAASAQAHVVFNQTNVAPAALTTLELRVTHGCNGSPTKEVRLKLPNGVTRVTPRALAGWQVAETKRPLQTPVVMHGETITQTVDTIVWSGGSFPDFAYQQFEVRAMMPNAPGTTLYFPVEQICENGSTSWSQIPATPAGWGALREPAPFVTLSGGAPAAASRGHRH
jgi:periplasmic copper chaperone A